jgi:DNA mismatch endonuclease (patch repair protein)
MDTLTPEQRSARMRLIRARDTGPELAVRRLVLQLRRGYRTHPGGVPGRPDIAFVGLRKAIFVHGCFWHRHRCALGRLPKSRLGFWAPKLRANQARDRRVAGALRSAGWDVLTIWECEIRDCAAVTDRLKAFLRA